MTIFRRLRSAGTGLPSLRWLALSSCFLAALASPQFAHAQGAAATSIVRSLERLLASPIARVAILETYEGREALRAILGIEGGARTRLGAQELQLAARRLSQGDAATVRLRSEFQASLTEIEREYRLKLRGPYSDQPAPLPERIDAQDLESLSRRHLQLSRSASGELSLIGVRSKSVDPSFAVPISFDHAVPIEHQSVEALLSRHGEGLYARLVDIEQRYFTERMLLFPDEMAIALYKKLGRMPTIENMLDQILVERNAMAIELDRLATSVLNRAPWAAETLRDAASQIKISPQALARYEENAVEAARVVYRAGEDYPLLGGYTALLRGEMGELRVAMRLAEVTARGSSVREAVEALAHNPQELKALSRELARLSQDNPPLFKKELDLVLGHGRVWAEVKYFRTIFSTKHGKWSDLKRQLELTKRIKKLLESSPLIQEALGGPLELRIYFINGIRTETATRLETLGYQVFGPRF